jgi:hypothetical protein
MTGFRRHFTPIRQSDVWYQPEYSRLWNRRSPMTGPTGTQKRHRSAVVVITSSSGMEKGRLAMSIPADVLKAHNNEYSDRCAEGSQRANNPADKPSPFKEFDLRTIQPVQNGNEDSFVAIIVFPSLIVMIERKNRGMGQSTPLIFKPFSAPAVHIHCPLPNFKNSGRDLCNLSLLSQKPLS